MFQIHDPQLDAPSRILVPVDLSPLSFQGLDLARHLGGAACAIRLFHVHAPDYSVPLYVAESVAPLYDPELTRSQMADEKKALAEYCAGSASAMDVKVVEAQSPAEAIAEEARAFKADLIVMTTHGRGGLSKLFWGSVAQSLFNMHPGPIVLLRPRRGSQDDGARP